jgi:hypothetical protein
MYLLAIVTLVIGLLGVYAQVLSLQAARFAASQNGLALTMMMWHDAAVSMGASIVDTGQFPPGSAPCSLTWYDTAAPMLPWATIPDLCLSPIDLALGGSVNVSGKGTVTGMLFGASNIYNTKLKPAPGGVEPVHLPPGYNTSVYQFYSVLYRDASDQPFIVTFVQPPVIKASNPAPGLLALPPTGHLIGLGMSDLLHQLHVSGLPSFAYGTVTNGATTSTLIASDFQYAMPQNTATGVPKPILDNGSAAIISSPAGL